MQSASPFSPPLPPLGMEDFFKRILDNLFDGVYFTDPHRTIIYWNRAAEEITGYTAEEVVGKRCADNILMHVNDAGHVLCETACPLSRTIADRHPRRAQVYLHHKRGHRVPVEVRVCAVPGRDGEVVGAVETFNDNSRQRAVREKATELAKLAFLDPTSQVANRRYLDQELSYHLDQHSQQGPPFGILLIDVDEFKNINDTHGHVAGDAALATIAKTLSGCLRASDVLGRWGGDEFLVILPGITESAMAETAVRCRAMVSQSTVRVESAQIRVTITVGTALVAAGDTAESLVKRADQHMYGSKQLGRIRGRP